MPIPLQSNLDMNNLRDQILWTLVNPGHLLDAPLLLRLEEMNLIADHLVACGLRFHPELQQQWYVPPRPDASILEAGAGRWVKGPAPGVPPAEASDVAQAPDDDAKALLDLLSDEQRAHLRKLLGEEGP